MLKNKQINAINLLALISLIHLSKSPENNEAKASANPQIIALRNLGPGAVAIR